MPRSNPKRRLDRSPLEISLTEIRFSPVLAMQTHIPQIQERLRKAGFPAFDAMTVQQLEMVLGAGEPVVKSDQRWVFSSTDSKNAIALTTGGVSIQTTAYVDFESFLELVKTTVDVLVATIEPSFSGRIGLRYVDVVRNIGSDLHKYFTEPVRTFTADDLGVESLQSNQYILAKTTVGFLQVKLSQVENASVLPLDLHTPELHDLTKPVDGVHAILDIDSADEARAEFSWESVESRLWGVHDYADSAFWKSVTKEAREIWGETQQ